MDAKDKPKLTAGEAYAGPGVPKNDGARKGNRVTKGGSGGNLKAKWRNTQVCLRLGLWSPWLLRGDKKCIYLVISV